MSERTCPKCHGPAREEARFCRACGASLTAGVPRPGWRARLASLRALLVRRRRRLLVVVAVVVVGVLVTTTLRTLSTTSNGPRQPVEDLIEAIEAGQPWPVAEMVGEHDSPLMPKEQELQGYTPPDSFEITNVQHNASETDDEEAFRPDRDRATVTVDLIMGGQKARPKTVEVKVQREETGWLRRWELRDAREMLAQISVDSRYAETVEVAGLPLEAARGFTSSEIWALPGHYTITVPEDDTDVDALFEFDDDITATAPPGELSEFDVDHVSIREDLHDQVADQVEDHLDDCAQSDSIRPTHCALGVESDGRAYRTVDSDSVEWTVLEQPDIDLHMADAATAGTAPITVETTTPGEATVTYNYEHVDADEVQEETVDIEVGGTVDVDEDGEVTWSG